MLLLVILPCIISLSFSSPLDRALSRLHNSVLQVHGSHGRKHLPDALIIGAKKCGTRALLEFLRIHPDIRATGPEVHFFDRHYTKGLDWYRNQMPMTLPGQMTMEKTPSYFVTKSAPERIYKMSKSTKLIVVVRDPVTRAISDYAQAASKRKNMPKFDEMAFLDGHVNTSWGAVKIGIYVRYVKNWLKFFPLNQIHFVNGEQLITNPGEVLHQVQKFLGLTPVVNNSHFFYNQKKKFPCLKQGLRSGRPKCLHKSKGRTHPDVDQRTIQRLQDFYRPFNRKLYQLTGIDFGY